MKLLKKYCIIILFLMSTIAAENTNTELIGIWPAGPSSKVTCNGDTLFASHGGFLEILNVSSHSSFLNIATLKIMGYIYDMEYKDGYLYIAEDFGLSIISLETLTNPEICSSIKLPGISSSLAIYENYIFIGSVDSSTSVIDISDPESPVLEKIFFDSLYWDLEVVDNYMIASRGHGAGVDILNIEDPLILQKEQTILDSINIMNVKVVDNQLFLLGMDMGLEGGIYLYNIADISNPSLMSHFYTYSQPMDIIKKENLLFTADDQFGVHITNIANPEDPQFVTYYDTPGYCKSICCFENSIFMAASEGGIQCLDISSTNNISLSRTLYSEGSSYSVAVDGNLALLGAGDIFLLDMTEPSNPVLLGSFEGTEFIADIEIQGDRALISDESEGLFLLDISDKSNPILLARFNPNEYCFKFDWIDDIIYLTAGQSFYILEINQDSINTKSTVGLSYAEDVKVLNNYAYIVDYNTGLEVVNISDPSNPTKDNTIDLAPGSTSIDIRNSTAFIAGQTGISAYNLTINSNPEIIDHLELPHYSHDIKISENFAYIAEGTKGCVVVDITAPDNMIISAQYDTPFHARGIAVNDDLAYIANDRYGLYIIKHHKNSNAINETHINPNKFVLRQNFPNPFNPSTSIIYSILDQSQIDLTIYDIRGKRIRTLVNSYQSEGTYIVNWDGKNDLGKVAPAGLYFYELQTPQNVQTNKMLLIK